MLLENYTGDSKVLKAIAHILNRKTPLPLDGDGDAEWGTNGQVLKTDGTGNTYWDDESGGGDSVEWTQIQASGTKIAEIEINGTSQDVYAPNGGGGGGGHTIWNRIKTALTARSNLWFADAKISDASADDATKVEVLTELADETAFDNLPTDGTADGMYAFPDSGAEYLDASMVGYGSGTVADALTWHEAASYLDALSNAVSEIALVGYADIHAPNKIGLVLIVPKILITDTYRFFQVGDRYNTSNQWHLQARMSIYGADAVGFYKDASEDSTATYKWLYK